ncbi:MAG TPA: chemotaxis protein CheW [Gallionella sp.]|nr:chemotaxis protein CheW [Gallionella sp.]
MSLVNACRALLLSRSEATLEPLPVRYCLTFTLHGIRFGIDTRTVNEVVRLGILAVPGDLPQCLRALYRHNGVMIPVLDIAARYGSKPLTQGGRSCLVVVGLGCGKWRRDIGLMVDEVLSVAEFQPDEMRPAPEIVSQMAHAGIVEGLVWQAKDFLIVLDALRLLPDAELEAVAAYMAEL